MSLPRQALIWEPEDFRRRPGRPRQNWKDVVKKDLRKMGISWDKVEEAAEDRRSWGIVSPNASLTHDEPGTRNVAAEIDRCSCYVGCCIWIGLPCTKHSADDVTLSNSSPTCSPLSPSITHSLFHPRLKIHLFHKSYPP